MVIFDCRVRFFWHSALGGPLMQINRDAAHIELQ
jgi:hypothetical protein